MGIGVGITTRNRGELAALVIKEWERFMPPGANLVVVDDASSPPFDKATYRFRKNVGISVAKNKCLELLDHNEHIFLADDDCFPVKTGWAGAYISPGIKHLSFTFPHLANGQNNERYLIKKRDGLAYYKQPCGCLLYVHRECLDVVGGMDVNYKMWGFEHVDYSQRIFNAGLTPHPFMDIANSLSVFCSLDYHGLIKSTSLPGRVQYGRQNTERYYKNIKSKEYYPYK
jgi:glycosyltransferase involved in cell wall biosynthesis